MVTNNHNIGDILRDIGKFLEMQNVPFKPRAFEKAADTVEGLEEDLKDVYEGGGIKAIHEIPGVGVSIAAIIEEFLKTGKVKQYEEMRKKMPVKLEEFRGVEGLGSKSIQKLYEELGIKTLADLEKAAKTHKIRTLKGFGEKVEENILRGIKFVKKSGGRLVLGFAMPYIQTIEERLRNLKDVEKIIVAGSVRRRKESIGDIDILVISKNPKAIMDYFVNMPEVTHILAHGETKSSVHVKLGLDVDLRVVPQKSYGAALNYFTGSKAHNVSLRQIAIKKGYKLNEYGLFKGTCQIAGATEEDLYKALGMDYVEPELREDTGEIEAAKIHKLPVLIGYNDLLGDLQVQTDWTDGKESIESMARKAAGRGLKYIAVTDHTKRLAMTHGLDEKRILKQMAEIDRLNKKFKGKIKILKGSECDILKDGSLDLPDSVLQQLDVVGVSVHSYFHLTRSEQTERVIRAMKNKNVDILFHPTGRIIGRREAIDLDMDAIIKTAKATGTVLEVDAFPDRLDLKDEYIKKCVVAGVRMSIDSDAHNSLHFAYLEYGLAQARRGWAEKKDIINTCGAEEILRMLKK